MAHTGQSEYPTGNPAYPAAPAAPAGYPAQTPPGYAYSNQQQNVPQQPVQRVIVRQPQQAAPSDYLVFAIIVTIFCCLPLGIVGIVKASEAKKRYASGDYDGAMKSSESAKTWSIVGLVTGCILITIGVILLAFVIIPLLLVAGATATALNDISNNY